MNTNQPLPRRARLRGVVLLCSSFVENLAFYRSIWRGEFEPLRSDDYPEAGFLRRAVNNFLDVAVLDWCKLFGNHKQEKHHWRRVVSSAESFEQTLLQHLEMTCQEYEQLVEKMLFYRDKFLAHLDDERVMNIPELDPAHKAVALYHRHVVQYEASHGWLAELPDIDALASGFRQCSQEAMRAYRKLSYIKTAP